MATGDSQQESLEALKLINAASTALRLYPADSAQVRNSTEKAYLGVKSFLREYELLRFSCHNGICLLAGIAVDKPTQERLQLLTFNDLLRKMGLHELVLTGSFDRPKFTKILSVFSVTPEQIQKAGGSRAFIDQLQLADVFPKEYIVPGESKEELAQKQRVDTILKGLAGNQVSPDDLHYLYGKRTGDKYQRQITHKFQTAKGASHCIAAACYSLLQILQKEKSVSVAPAFSNMLERVGTLVLTAGDGKHAEYAREAAVLLAPALEDPSLMILISQNYPAPFGSCFYEAIIKAVDARSLSRVSSWMKGQHEKRVSSPGGGTAQMLVISQAYERFLETSRAKQLLAATRARELLAKTEEGRKTKRVQVGIESLAAGNMEGLKNKEVCTSLPSTIYKLLQNDKEPLAAAIVQNVVNGLRNEDDALRSSFILVIGGVAEKLVLLERWDWLEKLTPVCLARLREIEALDSSYTQYVQAMQDMMNYAWGVGNNDLAESILDIFYYIRSGAFDKAEELRIVIAKIQDENVDLALLQAYLDECFIRPVNEIICKKITMQGPVAARFLLDTLISTDERSDRIRLLKLLSEIGGGLVPVLLERFPDPMPWYGKRNIIRLLTETGSEKNVDVVLPYMTHEDLRVQQESLQCILRLGKAAKGKYLLQVLPKVSLRMQIQIVKSLGRVADESVVAPLAELLRDCKLYNGEGKKVLAEEICHTLGASGSEKAIPVLQKIIDASGKVLGKESYTTAQDVIGILKELKKERLKPKKSPLPKKVVSTKRSESSNSGASESKKAIAVEYESVTDSEEEAEVYSLLTEDKLEGAKKLLLSLIKKSANAKQFKEAESLRLRLIDIDSMALADIIKAAEYIEDAKTAGVNEDHIIIWSELYDLLSTEEFNEFYHALVHDNYVLEKNIVKQGDQQRHLFFVNKGRVKLYYQEKENEILVKTIGRGQVFGGDSFFNDSVWTLNATSMGSVELSTLAVDDVREWKEAYPALEPKIRDYCKRVSTEQEFFQSSGANRRNEKRYQIDEPVKMELLAEDGTSEKTIIKGIGSDISSGGLSFVSRISRRKHARMLLGRSVTVSIERDEATTVFQGHIVAVRNLHSVDLGRSVHISFDKELTETVLLNLIK
jgi:Cyclic nucleotide-binding domain/PilZ domain